MAISKKPAATPGRENFPEAYMRLRTVLDGLELTALRYCLNDNDTAKRIRRAKEIDALLMPIIKELESKMQTSSGPIICPDGYNDCGGCCVPYQCP